MGTSRKVRLSLMLTFGMLCSWEAWADRLPTQQEQVRIEEALRKAGFKSWKKIELDDDRHWEVDDAVLSDGRKYDLTLDRDLNVIERDRE